MAERRMFAKSIVENDRFYNMPKTAQVLYFHLAMTADDDGFNSSAKNVVRNIRAKKSDFELLKEMEYIIEFPSGVVAVSDWRIHNYIRKDRYNESSCIKEKAQIKINQSGKYFV